MTAKALKIFSTKIAVVLLTASLLPRHLDASERYEGWWVVLATLPEGSDVGPVHDRAHRCGIKVFSDFSEKFKGLAQGYIAFVQAGEPNKSRVGALEALRPARRCFSDAYIKYGWYLGE